MMQKINKALVSHLLAVTPAHTNIADEVTTEITAK
jgi:hypothetical protein